MELIFLGTSGATPTQDRNLPAIALRLDSGQIVLFDSGEDVQRRFEAANLKFNVPTTIFISHLHGDHIIGLPGLLFNFHLNSRSKPLSIIGPVGLASFLMMHYQTVGLKAMNYPLTVKEIYSIDDTPNHIENKMIIYTHFLTPNFERKVIDIQNCIIEENSQYHVSFRWVDHSVPTMGFRFEESPLDGKFDPERAEELSIPKGPIWKRLQKGRTVQLKDGRTIDPVESGIVTSPRPGRIVSYSGDSGKSENLITLAQDADYFICEATYEDEHTDLAIEKKHLTSTFAAEIAKKAHVRKLILTHFSSRYKSLSILEKQAQKIFPETIAAKDLLSISIFPREQSEEE